MRAGFVAAIAASVILGGCVKEFSYPTPIGTRLRGKALEDRISGATVYGRYYRTNNRYIEQHEPTGSYVIRRTREPDSSDYNSREEGRWSIKNDQVCYEFNHPDNNRCAIVYELNGQFEFVNPETGKAWSTSYRIEYQGEGGKAAAITSKPVEPETPESPQVGSSVPQAGKKLEVAAAGSGFFVSNQTYLLTNNHVIDECTEVTARIDNQHVRAIVAARDQRNDLALLRLPAGERQVAVFRANDGLYPGDSVVAIGYPLSDILASEGNVSVGIVSALAGPGNDASLLQVSAPVQPGNSGGPLFDMSGNVVGVIVAGLGVKFLLNEGTLAQNVNFAIKSTVAIAFLQASGVEYRSENSSTELRAADVARKGRPAPVPVSCWK
jgi:S1-C subfamily serine protease